MYGQLQHVYVTAHGEYTAASWLGEKAQMGLRIAVFSDGEVPAKGAFFSLSPEHGNVAVDTGTLAGTNGTLTKTWTARLGPTGSTENADGTWQVDLAEDMRTFLVALAATQYTGFRWTHIKIAPIEANGDYAAPSATYQFTTPVVGGSTGSFALPPEVALAVSLRAPVIGRRGRGRMYLPGLCTAWLADQGVVNPTPRGTVQTALVALVGNLENAPGLEEQHPTVVVMSAGSGVAVRPSEVRIGNHHDVQKRRQQQVAETFTSTAL